MNRQQEHDNVNHPKHYEGSTSLDCIDCMKLILGREAVLYFCLGNSFKYLWRYKNKNGMEDINKAKWYLDYVGNNLKRDSSEPISDKITLIYHRIKGLYDSILPKVYSKF